MQNSCRPGRAGEERAEDRGRESQVSGVWYSGSQSEVPGPLVASPGSTGNADFWGSRHFQWCHTSHRPYFPRWSQPRVPGRGRPVQFRCQGWNWVGGGHGPVTLHPVTGLCCPRWCVRVLRGLRGGGSPAQQGAGAPLPPRRPSGSPRWLWGAGGSGAPLLTRRARCRPSPESHSASALVTRREVFSIKRTLLDSILF